jgi:GMP synthase (glutamine-hydrolysing)
VTPNQAFDLGTFALGLQFHAECNGTDIEHWLVGHAAEHSAAAIDVSALRAASKTEGMARHALVQHCSQNGSTD